MEVPLLLAYCKKMTKHINNIVICQHTIMYVIFHYTYVIEPPGRYSAEAGREAELSEDTKIMSLL